MQTVNISELIKEFEILRKIQCRVTAFAFKKNPLPSSRPRYSTVFGAGLFIPSVYAASASALPADTTCASQVIGTLSCIPYFLKNIINAAFILAAVIAVVLIILSGIRLMLSGGDVEKVAKAKRSLTFTIIGLVIILLSFVIINLIGRVTGTNI